MKHIKENCMACGVELTTNNWYPSRMRKKERNCIPCHDIKRLERRIKQKGKIKDWDIWGYTGLA